MSDHDVLRAGEMASQVLSREWELDDAAAIGGRHRGFRDTGVAAPHSGQSNKNRSAKVSPHAKIGAEKVLRSFNTWAFKREQPADPHLMLRIISESIALGEPVSFVLYWGKGPRCWLDEPDIECLDYLSALGRRVREAYQPGAAIKLIFTDTHAELNGHSPHSIRRYFAEVAACARQRGFETCRMSQLTRTPEVMAASDPSDDTVPEDLLVRLSAGARKWYRGDGTAEQGALNYYRMNMVEKRAVELAFPRSIFVTFNDSEFRALFPSRLPIFYMYSLRRGVSIKPWFVATDATSYTA